MSTTTNVPEMGRYLRQIVDNSLEEGQFESAIDMLEMLRNSYHNPSMIHILHIIFISLHPISRSCRLDDNPDGTLSPSKLLQQSPRKIIKHTKSALVLSPQAVLAAQRLLMSFISTNGPEILSKALPLYPETKGEPPMEFEFVDSPIFYQASSIKNARSIWEILKSGYTSKTKEKFGTPGGRSRQGRKSALSRDSSFAQPEWTLQDDIKVVGEDSWFLLDWLVSLYEKDAELTEESGSPKHSRLLLKQLPPPPIGSSTRWDASEPLKVVFYAFQQDSERYQHTGLRLLNLLIDLTYTPHLNLPAFASTVLAQLASSPSSQSSNNSPTALPIPVTPPPYDSFPKKTSTNMTPQESLTFLFAKLPATPASLFFKIQICKKILLELDSSAGAESSACRLSSAGGMLLDVAASNGVAECHSTPTKRPRPRAQPRLAQGGQPSMVGEASTSTSLVKSPTSSMVFPISHSTSGSSTVTTSSTVVNSIIAPSTPTTPLIPIFIPPPLPRFADVTMWVISGLDSSLNENKAQCKAPPEKRARRRTIASADPDTPTTLNPWTSSFLFLLRVRFELLAAWVLLRIGAQEQSLETEKNINSNDLVVKDEDEKNKIITLVDQLFSPAGDNSDEDRIFYKEVISAFAGISATK